MVRVDANSSNSDLLVTAYEGKENARTIIATNRGTSPQMLTVDWPGAVWRVCELRRPGLLN
jgi:hypothetical protein